MGGVPYHHHQFQMENGGFEEPQTPTTRDGPHGPHGPHGQMSFEDAIDGGHNSGSYNAGQQQRRIIREIIV